MEEKETLKISYGGPVAAGLALGGGACAVVLILFGLVGHAWLIGALAGSCCLLGGFACGFMWRYMKQAEKWYREHPQPSEDGEPETETENGAD